MDDDTASAGIPTFAGTSILVTGGGSGIGLGIARSLVASGAHVTICGRNKEKLEAAAESIRQSSPEGSVSVSPADVTIETDVVARCRRGGIRHRKARRSRGLRRRERSRGHAHAVTQLDVDAWRAHRRPQRHGDHADDQARRRGHWWQEAVDPSSRSRRSPAATHIAGSARTESRNPASTTWCSWQQTNWAPATFVSTRSARG